MLISNNKSVSIFKFYLVLLIIIVISFWFSQNSINSYWQQTYHEDSILTKLDQFSWWNKGAEIQQEANKFYTEQKTLIENIHIVEKNPVVNNLTIYKEVTFYNATFDYLQAAMQIIQYKKDKNGGSNSKLKIEQEDKANLQNLDQSVDKSLENETNILAKTKFVSLKSTDKVLFAGDSLMQGVAPHIQRWLKSQYNIQSYDLSKQSTGLSYPSFFNWPKTIENTLNQHSNIRLLIIFLGPNDPWDFPDPKKTYQYLKFKSPEWEIEYKNRIMNILNSAEKHGVQVIWLGIPYMKKTKLNQQMAYLNQILIDTISLNHLLLPTENLLSNNQNIYLDSIFYNGKKIRVRSKDGIHFSLEGQRILAEYVQQYISVQ